MLFKVALSIFFLLSSLPAVFSQTKSKESYPDYWHNRNILERMGSGTLTNGNIPALNTNMAEIKGDVYLTPYFSPAVFRLYKNDQVIEGLDAKLDLKKNEFDVRTANGIMALAGSKVKDLIMQDSLTKINRFFVNAKDYQTETGVPLIGFYEIISSGIMPLVKFHKVVVKTDYHPTLIKGGKEFTYLTKSDLFYIENGIVKEIPNKKKRILLFQSFNKEMISFIDSNNIDLGKENHLIGAFDYYNKLLSEKSK